MMDRREMAGHHRRFMAYRRETLCWTVGMATFGLWNGYWAAVEAVDGGWGPVGFILLVITVGSICLALRYAWELWYACRMVKLSERLMEDMDEYGR